MPRLQAGLSPNIAAFLDMIAVSEIGEELMHITDDGYDVVVGSTVSKPVRFESYAGHPNIFVPPPINSTAAGRYQVLHRYWTVYKTQLRLPDFGPESQDRIALQLIGECHAIPMIEAGRFEDAVVACSSRWASLPGSKYGQHVNDMAALKKVWVARGGVPAEDVP